ncbi:SUKH-3 domain-containing protein [Streptomyces sp. HMX112]|uniref:SUKH-3 domain-containing protein n=1 Tax=Streptomyces sp. HMX112 TaxID=3390850 RepID=UPI003A80386C
MTSGHGALAEAGWHPGRDARAPAMLRVLETIAAEPRWSLFPAAERALCEFHGLRVQAAGPGRDVAGTGCTVDPVPVRHFARSLARLGEVVGTHLFPFGLADTGAVLTVDEDGRLFSLDHGGARLLGESVLQGIVALTEGHAPSRVAPREWRWPIDGAPGGDALERAVSVALVAVYVLHRGGLFDARELRLRVTSLRGVGVLVLDRVFALFGGPLENSAAPLVEGARRAMADEGVGATGAEVRLSVLPPPGTCARAASVDCSVRVVETTDMYTPVVTLTAGAAASVGPVTSAVRACVDALGEYAGSSWAEAYGRSHPR